MKTVTIQHTRRNVVDVGHFPTESDQHPEGFHLILGSTDDAGVAGQAQPEQVIPADVWEQAARLKPIQHMLETNQLIVRGARL